MTKCIDCRMEANEEYMYWRTGFDGELVWRCKECDDIVDEIIAEIEDKFDAEIGIESELNEDNIFYFRER